jgi:hypothetical protein
VEYEDKTPLRSQVDALWDKFWSDGISYTLATMDKLNNNFLKIKTLKS